MTNNIGDSAPYKPARGQSHPVEQDIKRLGGFEIYKTKDRTLVQQYQKAGPFNDPVLDKFNKPIIRSTVLMTPEGVLKIKVRDTKRGLTVRIDEGDDRWVTTGEGAMMRMLTRLALSHHRSRIYWVIRKHKVIGRGVIGASGTVLDGPDFTSISGFSDFKPIDSLTPDDRQRIIEATYDRPPVNKCRECGTELKSPKSRLCSTHLKAFKAKQVKKKRAAAKAAMAPVQLQTLQSHFQAHS